MDKSTVCSMALNAIGKADYAGGTPGGEACDLYFGHVYAELLSKHDWSFARRIVTLAADDEGRYTIPPDCLRIVELVGLRNWRIYGTKIHPELEAEAEGRVEIIYTSSQLADRGELPDRCRAFIQAVVLKLAATLAAAVAHDDRKSDLFEGLALRALREAMTLDTQQDNSNDQHPLNRMLDNSITRGGF